MKSQLPALIMLLSEFRKPIRAVDRTLALRLEADRSFGIPTPAVGEAGVPDSAGTASVYRSAASREAGGFPPPISRGVPWVRSKKKRFG
jgi:hypothetical protein